MMMALQNQNAQITVLLLPLLLLVMLTLVINLLYSPFDAAGLLALWMTFFFTVADTLSSLKYLENINI